MFLFKEWSDIYLTYEMQCDALAARRRSAEKICFQTDICQSALSSPICSWDFWI